jgi:hypothetical protein
MDNIIPIMSDILSTWVSECEDEEDWACQRWKKEVVGCCDETMIERWSYMSHYRVISTSSLSHKFLLVTAFARDLLSHEQFGPVVRFSRLGMAVQA